MKLQIFLCVIVHVRLYTCYTFLNRQKMHITHHFLLHSTVHLSSYFDKSHLELWGKKQVLIQRASNLSHCLKSWKNIWPWGLFNTIFSIYPHLPGLFFPQQNVSDDSCQGDGICDRNSLSPFLSISLSPRFICTIRSVTWLLTHKWVHVPSLERTNPMHGPDIKQFD